MNKKDKFIEVVEKMFNATDMIAYCNDDAEFANDVLMYFDAFKGGGSAKPAFTENGLMILRGMKDNKDTFNNMFKAKELAEVLGVTSRTVSGAARKLVTDGYLEKIGDSPVVYSLTDKALNLDLEEIEKE